MELSKREILNIVNKYTEHKIEKKEILNFCQNATREIFKDGGILCFEYTAIYNFVCILNRVYDDLENDYENKDNYISDIHDEILDIKEIIDGKKDKIYAFDMLLPSKYIGNGIDDINTILNITGKYKSVNSLSRHEADTVKAFCRQNIDNDRDIIKILKSQLTENLLMWIEMLEHSDNDIENKKIRLRKAVYFDSGEKTRIPQDLFLRKIIKTLKCLNGEDYCSVCVYYKNGVPNVSVSS